MHARRKGSYCRRCTNLKTEHCSPPTSTHTVDATDKRWKQTHTACSTPVPEERVIDRRHVGYIHKQTQPQPDANRHQQSHTSPIRMEQRDCWEGGQDSVCMQEGEKPTPRPTHREIRTVAVPSMTVCMQAHVRVLDAALMRNITYHTIPQPPRCRQLLDLPQNRHTP